MLSRLDISNYTIIAELGMEFSPGMTAITGETGAGKSIMVGALGLCLGDRADPAAVRAGCERAEIAAAFDISALPAPRGWLAARHYEAGGECILRRVITREGRSRAFINGNGCTLQECAELAELLVDIHSQHAHQSLLRRDYQRALLDAYAGQAAAARETADVAAEWLRLRRELDELQGRSSEQAARAELLRYQVDELEQLALQPGELEALEREQKQLAGADRIQAAAGEAMDLCLVQAEGARRALGLLQDDAIAGKAAKESREMLDSAAIQLEEAHRALRDYLDAVENNPARLAEVEQRLDAIYNIARKHRVQAPALAELHQALAGELAGLGDEDARIAALEEELAAAAARHAELAAALSAARRGAAGELQGKIEAQLGELAMAQCRLEVRFTSRAGDAPHPHGLEEVELLVSTNPGQAPRPIGKIASGGELSRLSLAIQVVCAGAGDAAAPCMIFDEVDAGIGGAVAETVGRLLRAIAGRSQVLCVTHLPQVASQGQQHLRVSKSTAAGESRTDLSRLTQEQRVEEIARMLGGIDITGKTLAAAKEMLEAAG